MLIEFSNTKSIHVRRFWVTRFRLSLMNCNEICLNNSKWRQKLSHACTSSITRKNNIMLQENMRIKIFPYLHPVLVHWPFPWQPSSQSPTNTSKNKSGKFIIIKDYDMHWFSFKDFSKLKLKTFVVYELHHFVIDINLCYSLPLSRAQFGICRFFPLQRNLTCGTRAPNGKGEVTLFQLYKWFIWLIYQKNIQDKKK